MATIPLTGLAFVVLFLILIAIKQPKKPSDLFLGLFFILVGAELIYRTFCFGLATAPNWLTGLDLGYWVLLGPAIYLYALFIIRKDRPFRLRLLFHLIPLAVVMVPFVHYLFLDTKPGNFFIFANHHLIYRLIIDLIWEFCVSVYLVVTFLTVLRYRKRIPGFFSSRKQKELNWLLYLSGGFLFYILFSLGLLYLMDYGLLPVLPVLNIISVVVLILFLMGVGVFGYRQQGIFSEHTLEAISNIRFEGNLSAHPEKEFKYQKSGLQDQETEKILQELKRLMKTDKPYLDPELNLQDLASRLSTTIHKLSQVINEQFHQNFYDFINTYRIEEVMKLLHNSRFNHLKVIAIAYDCGFNSKSAFYTAFRKATTMTPVEYRRKYQPEHGAVFSN